MFAFFSSVSQASNLYVYIVISSNCDHCGGFCVG